MKKSLLSAFTFRTANTQGALTAIQQANGPNQMTVLTDDELDQVKGGGSRDFEDALLTEIGFPAPDGATPCHGQNHTISCPN